MQDKRYQPYKKIFKIRLSSCPLKKLYNVECRQFNHKNVLKIKKIYFQEKHPKSSQILHVTVNLTVCIFQMCLKMSLAKVIKHSNGNTCFETGLRFTNYFKREQKQHQC